MAKAKSEFRGVRCIAFDYRRLTFLDRSHVPHILAVLSSLDVDMWGVGCILAGLLLRREPFFRG